MIGTLVKHIAKIGSGVVIFFTFLSYLAPYVHPTYAAWLAHFATIYPWLLILNIGFVLFWALASNRFALYHLLIIFIGWQHITHFIGMNGSKPPTQQAFTLVSHNIGEIFHGKNFKEQWDKAISEYVQFLKRNGDPDVLCLQETSGKIRELFIQKSGYPYHFGQGKGTIIFSRYPMEAGGELPFEQTGNSALWVNIVLEDSKFRIYNLHLQSNAVSVDAEQLIQSGELEKKESWLHLGKILNRVSINTKKRAKQAEIIKESISKCNLPVVICGDFNDTPNSFVYHQLSAGMHDTFAENGRGLGTTFSGSIPFLKIDYALTSKEFGIFDAGIIRKRFSDHYPVYAVIGL